MVNTSLAKFRLAIWAGPAAGYGLAIGAVAVAILTGPLDRDTTVGGRLIALAGFIAATTLFSLLRRFWFARLPRGDGGRPYQPRPWMWFFTSAVHGRLTSRRTNSGVSKDKPSERKLR
ncbi:MAG: hypothetical protein JWN52_5787 [Actinomycetia bacterium]|nr:hypothetical protein [Actinomycetes bacterium]